MAGFIHPGRAGACKSVFSFSVFLRIFAHFCEFKEIPEKRVEYLQDEGVRFRFAGTLIS
jgi:hypothetical protein